MACCICKVPRLLPPAAAAYRRRRSPTLRLFACCAHAFSSRYAVPTFRNRTTGLQVLLHTARAATHLV